MEEAGFRAQRPLLQQADLHRPLDAPRRRLPPPQDQVRALHHEDAGGAEHRDTQLDGGARLPVAVGVGHGGVAGAGGQLPLASHRSEPDRFHPQVGSVAQLARRTPHPQRVLPLREPIHEGGGDHGADPGGRVPHPHVAGAVALRPPPARAFHLHQQQAGRHAAVGAQEWDARGARHP